MKKLFTFSFILFSFFAKADYWTQKADFGGTARGGASYFSIGNKGYIGMGTDAYPNYHFKNDFWEYDTTLNTWTQKANFPGTARYTALSFSIGTKGYIGTGWDQITPLFNDLWEYNQVNNTWTQKGNFPGLPRQSAFAMVVNNKAYAGLGANVNILLNDFYSYNDTTDTWTPLANFAGMPRSLPFGFGINSKIYMGCGVISLPGFNLGNDFWVYDILSNVWTQKANFPGTPRYALGYFATNNKGYAGIGKDVTTFYSDFYQYDPILNSWTQKTSSPVTGIESGFSIGFKGYVGCGYTSLSGLTKQFWEYTTDSTTGIEDLPTSNLGFTISPNPAKDYIVISYPLTRQEKLDITITDVAGKEVYESKLLISDFRLPVSNFQKGIYFVELSNGKDKAVKKFVKE